MRTGAASGVAAKHLARPGAASLGLIGAGWQAESQLAAIRAAVPSIERVVVSSRTAERAEAFAARTAPRSPRSPSDAGGCDVVVTATTSTRSGASRRLASRGSARLRDRRERPAARELDAQVIARATLVCCDSLEDARLESGDLIEPVAAGQLDWLEVQELHQIVSGELPGRQSDADIVVFKSNGIAPWDLAIGHEVVRRAAERGVGDLVVGRSRSADCDGEPDALGAWPSRVPDACHAVRRD